jgi:SAM-dependent methyltransferase
MAEGGFGGEVAGFYHRYRHGYPPAVIDLLAGAFGLGNADMVVDLGCGTGQLTLPIARRVRAVAGVDPEPDMLRLARRAAVEQNVPNVTWILGSDADLPVLGRLCGEIAAVTVGQALHWMDHEELFRTALPMVRPGGGVAVVTNGTPQWLQDTAWSRALRGYLEKWLGRTLTHPCGTDADSQRRYAEALRAAGYDVVSGAVDYNVELDLDQLVGGVYSALSPDLLPPPDQRPVFAEEIRAALAPGGRFTEHVHVAILAGRR